MIAKDLIKLLEKHPKMEIVVNGEIGFLGTKGIEIIKVKGNTKPIVKAEKF